MPRALLFLFLLAGGAVCQEEKEGEEAARPNVLLILADDLGYEGLGCDGGPSGGTPRLDRLAGEGMRFLHAYSQPLCTPSRAKLLTGQSNARNYQQFRYLKPGTVTFARLLRDAGYRTAIAGKWQLSGKSRQGLQPEDAGFQEHCLWDLKRGGSRYWDPVMVQDGRFRRTSDQDFGPDLFCDYLVEFLRRSREGPFLACYSMVLPHYPFVVTPDRKEDPPTGAQEQFQAMVSYLDRLVGRLLDELDALGLRENTLVLFTADNGTDSAVQTPYGGRWLRGGKGRLDEAGMHVPLLASWPGVIAAGSECRELVDFSDFLPTFLELAGVAAPADLPLDGHSFLPLLRGEEGPIRDAVYCYYWPFPGDGRPRRLARDQAFQLMDNGVLWDLREDPYAPRVVPDEEAEEPAVKAAREKLQAVLDRSPSRPDRRPREGQDDGQDDGKDDGDGG